MIALSGQSDEEPLGRVDRLLQRVCGHPREFPVHHQVLNWLLSMNVFLVGLAGIENTLLGIVPSWQLYVASAIFGLVYYLTRVRRIWVGPLSVLSLAIWLTMLVLSWFTSGGLVGGTPIWMFMGLVWIGIFRSRLARVLAIGLWLGEFVALAGIEWVAPDLIVPYANAMVQYVDMAFAIALISLYLIGYVLILSYNLEQRQQQAEGLLLNILPKRI